MTTYGIKLTHDAATATLGPDGQLLLCVEAEKIKNRPRHDTFYSIHEAMCHALPVGAGQIVVDGWKGGTLSKHNDLPVATYHDFDGRLWERSEFEGYFSYKHVEGHVLGSYAMSPFAKEGRAAHVLCWDGGMGPMLYLVGAPPSSPVFKARLFPLYAMVYGIMCYYEGPYSKPGFFPDPGEDQFGRRDFPGKIMSWLEVGRSPEFAIYELCKVARQRLFPHQPLCVHQTGVLEHNFITAAAAIAERHATSLLGLVHDTIERLLLDGIREHVPDGPLIFTGGAALNIKWNSAIRAMGGEFWVPPCPNDSGSAIGAAAAHLWRRGVRAIDWSVYAGREPEPGPTPRGWKEEGEATPEAVGRLLVNGEFVVRVDGRAEIGPRALGNRSILALPTSGARDALNAMKGRESWRPVAPICKEDRAPDFFSPGTPDPYMLFDHRCLPDCWDLAPAIVHKDNSARLQTVNRVQNPFIYDVLSELERAGLPPIVCNTSANLNGCGFFDSGAAAMDWAEGLDGETPIVVNEGKIWRKTNESS